MSDPSGMHRLMRLSQNHTPHSFEYANAAAREGATGLVSTDVGKMAWQLDDHSLWQLVSASPLTWAKVGGGLDAEVHSGGTNYNDLAATGFHVVLGNASDTNTPFGVSNSCTLDVIQYDANNITQVAVRLGADGFAYRQMTAGTWGSWINAAASTGFTGMARYLTAGTYSWTVPDGVTAVRVICVGGGGGAAGASLTSPSGSGGGGGYSEKIVTGLTPGSTVTVTVGAGGSAGSSTVNGGAGGASSFGSHVTAPGGGGGTKNSQVSGGGGSPTTTGALNIPGEDGENYTLGTDYWEIYGGASFLSGRRTPGHTLVPTSNSTPLAGVGIGCGACGGIKNSSAYVGAAGAAGAVIIQY